MSQIRPTSRVLAVIGDPVEHSLSPAMHNAAINALGIDAVYIAIRADGVALAHVVRAFEATGISGNVTVPHKIAVAQLLIRLTGAAQELGAVNTFFPEGGRLVGDNTDAAGLLDALEGLDPQSPWLVAGTGGSARAVAAAARARSARLLVRSRDPARAASFSAWARGIGVDAHADTGEPAPTVLNATPLGLHPNDPSPIPADRLNGARAAFDLVYAPGETPWVRACRDRGLRAADGRGMLVAQGAHAFERFFPGTTAPREIMAAVVRRALEP